MTSWLTAEQAAERLGVKTATVYSYISRGALSRRRAGDGRSVFDESEVEQLARRGRPRRSGNLPELVIESAVTALGEDRQYYRGHDALELAEWCDLEDIADWLWTGDETALARTPTGDHTPPVRTPTGYRGSLRHTKPGDLDYRRIGRPEWVAPERAVAAGRLAQRGLPKDVLPLERLQVITPVLATYDPLRLTPSEASVAEIGRSLIAGMIACLPGNPVHGPLSANLWVKLTPRVPEGRWLDVLRAAMVLAADHELAASTLAVRVAASVRADPYAVVSAGLGATSGALHGGASLGAEALLEEIEDPAHAAYVVGQRLRRGERIPGFGHKVYRAGDGRANVLFDRIRAADPKHPRLAVAEAVLAEARRRKLPAMNVDFALATLVNATNMQSGSGEAIFAISRTVGWLAHALEEYAKPMRFRLRAVYVGSPVQSG
jgi:citrate synthase